MCRFLPPAGTMLARSTPGRDHCGTIGAGWSDASLPDELGSTVDIEGLG